MEMVMSLTWLAALRAVGSRGEFSFEAGLHRRVPHCDVHVFDQTLKSVNLLCLVLLVFWYQREELVLR